MMYLYNGSVLKVNYLMYRALVIQVRRTPAHYAGTSPGLAARISSGEYPALM